VYFAPTAYELKALDAVGNPRNGISLSNQVFKFGDYFTGDIYYAGTQNTEFEVSIWPQ
jgi:hypothetical protein